MLTPLVRGSILTTVLAAATVAQAQTAIPFVVNDLYVMPNSILGNSQPGVLTTYNGYGYFAATSAVNGRELWRTDGTAAGTALVRDINPGTAGSSPESLVVWNGLLYFTADDGAHGREIWRSDGTPTGTRMVADYVAGPSSANPNSLVATPFGVVLGGAGLCVTTNGTTISSIAPSGACCLPTGACTTTTSSGCGTQSGMWAGLNVACAAITCNQPVSLSCCMPDKSCVYLTSTNCTTQGGTPNAPNTACGGCPDPAAFVCCSSSGVCSVGSLASCVNGQGTFLFLSQSCTPDPCPEAPFACCLPSGQCFMLRLSDDCSSRGGVNRPGGGTCLSGTYSPGCTQPTFACCRTTGACTVSSGSSCRSSGGFIQPLGVACGGSLCFQPNTTDVSPSSGTPVAFDGRAIVFAQTSGQMQIWITDGTSAGSQRLASGPAQVNIPGPMLCASGRMFFSSSGSASPANALWSTDGTAVGTGAVSALAGVTVYPAAATGSSVYYGSPDALNHIQLWCLDMAGGMPVQLTTDALGGQPGDVTPFQGGAMFSMLDPGQVRRRWWFTDGTPAGTRLVGPLGNSSYLFSNASVNRIVLGSSFVFAGGRPGSFADLWISDGTSAGTRQVYPIPEAEWPMHPGDSRNWYGLDATTFSVFNNHVFFKGTDQNTGEADALWSSDGTLAGTGIVAHIPGSQQPSIGNLTPGAGENLFFSGESAATGTELFKTSGTPASTGVVKDLVPGSNGSFPSNITYNNGVVLFDAKATANAATPILHRSDGSAAGTLALGSALPNCCGGSRAAGFAGMGGHAYFFETSEAAGMELWRSNGTAAGTGLVAEAIAGPTDGIGTTPKPAVFNGLLVYGARNGLYRSDGTAAGTYPVYSFAVGGAAPQILASTPIGILFTGTTGGLWYTDGTVAGTRNINSNGPGFDTAGSFVFAGGKIYFAGYAAASGWELWATDGTVAGTQLVEDFTPGNPGGFNNPGPLGLQSLGSNVYFYLPGPGGVPSGWYASDGTAAGTRALFTAAEFPHTIAGWFAGDGRLLIMTKQTSPSRYDLWSYTGTVASLTKLTAADPLDPSYPFTTAVVAGPYTYLVRSASGGQFQGMYRTDGTAAGTAAISRANLPSSVSFVSQIVPFGDDVCFSTTTGSSSSPGGQVFRTGAPGTSMQLVFDLVPWGVSATNLASASGLLYFVTPVPIYGWQVMVSDGTPAGTHLLNPVNTAMPQLNATAIRAAGSLLYFTDGGGLYKSDGSTAGSSLVGTFTGGWSLAQSADVGGTLVFKGSSPTSGVELWRSDGTVAGTSMIADLAPGSASSGPSNISAVGSLAFFAASNIPNGANFDGAEPCVSDGTAAGTHQARKLSPAAGGASYPERFTDLDGLTIFVADNHVVGGVNIGNEIFRSDGTSAGTYLLKDILPGVNASYPRDLVAAGEFCYFTADDGVHGRELWRTDGSTAGTVIVRDICAGDLGSVPANLVAADDRIFFTAYTPETGIELWTSDGTAVGTFMLFEIIPGPSSADIKSVTRAGGRIYFQATVPPQRPSLWSFDWASGLAGRFLCPADFSRSDGVSVQDIFDFLNEWFVGTSRADINGNGTLEVLDIFEFINIWLAGC